MEDDVEEKTLYTFLWTFANVIILIPLFLYFAEKMGKASIVLTVLMSVLTFWREWFMLILFVLRKYTVKDGEVCDHRKTRKINIGGTPGPGKRCCWFSVVYVLDFEDVGERIIPVMVDLYTYLRLKKNGDALLINNKYGESYLFELVKAKKKVSDLVQQDEVAEYKSGTRADEEAERESEPKTANEPEPSDKAIVTNLT